MHSPWATGRKRSKALKTSPFSKAGPWEKTEMQKETGFFSNIPKTRNFETEQFKAF